MKRLLLMAGLAVCLSACLMPLPPAPPPLPPPSPPIPPEPMKRTDQIPPPSRKIQPLPSVFRLPNGQQIRVVGGTELLSSCAVFGITDTSRKPSVCIAVPSSMADGRGGGRAQNTYTDLLRSAGYAGRALPLAYRDSKGCRQHVMLSTLPADAQRSDNWSGVNTYILFMEFTPLTCPES